MKIALVYMDPKGAPEKGAGYIMSSIPAKHEVILHNDNKDLPGIISKGNYDILMVSTMTTLYPAASALIKKVKSLCNIPVLMGGVHPTVYGPKLLEENSDIDYLCIGEGEIFIKEFLLNWGKDSLFDINNLAYIKNGVVVTNTLSDPVNMATLPSFPWAAFKRPVGPRGNINITATRGCPHSCTYCCNSNYLKIYGKKYLRFRPIDDVISEIKYLKKNFKFKMVSFGDEMIFFNKKYITELFTRIKDEINVPYGCMGRVENVDEEMTRLLKSTGCKYVSMGVECGDEIFRRERLKRFMSNEQIKKAFRLLKTAGIQTISFNMIGWPWPRIDDKLTQATINLNKELNPDVIQVTWFYPLPGTELYDYCVEHDLINRDKIIRSYHKSSIIKGYENKKSIFKSKGQLRV